MSKPLTEFHAHEALDRAFVLLDAWGSYVIDHPFVSENPKLQRLAKEAHDKMFDVYQAIAQASLMLDGHSWDGHSWSEK